MLRQSFDIIFDIDASERQGCALEPQGDHAGKLAAMDLRFELGPL